MATVLFLGGWIPPWPAAYGSSLVPSAIFAVAGAVAIYHGLNPARRLDRYTLPVFGFLFLAIAGLFLLPAVQQWLLPLFWFLAKTGAILFAFIWIRGTLPRFRYDQLMGFTWKFLFPVAMLNLLATGLLVALYGK
jgi:NADH-quinone oxidoreductase subunit H